MSKRKTVLVSLRDVPLERRAEALHELRPSLGGTAGWTDLVLAAYAPSDERYEVSRKAARRVLGVQPGG